MTGIIPRYCGNEFNKINKTKFHNIIEKTKNSFLQRFRCGFCGQAFQSEELFLSHLRKRKRRKLTVIVKPEKSKKQPVQPKQYAHVIVSDTISVTGAETIIQESVIQLHSQSDLITNHVTKSEDICSNDDLNRTCLLANKKNKDKYEMFEFSGPLLSGTEPSFFDCTECCFRGKTSEVLAGHVTTHPHRRLHLIREREKVYYDCSKCCFRASSNTALQNHTRILHRRLPYLDCSDCWFRAQTEEALSRHLKIRH